MSENYDDLEMNQSPSWKEDDNVLCLKVKFFAQSARIYGIILIFLDTEELYLNDVLLNLSTFSINYNKISRESDYRQFYKIITDNVKEMIHSQKKNYFRIKNTIEKKFNPAEKLKKLKVLPEGISIIEEDLKELLRHCTSDKKIIILGSFETAKKGAITNLQQNLKQKQDFEIQKKIASEKQDNTKNDLNHNNDALHEKENLTKCTPVVSPVTGVPISDLEVGDCILIIHKNSTEENEEDSYGKNNVEIQKVLIIEKEFDGKNYLLTVKLNDLSYGLLEEPDNIKIKTVFHNQDVKEFGIKKRLGKAFKIITFLIGIIISIIIVVLAGSLIIYLINTSFSLVENLSD